MFGGACKCSCKSWLVNGFIIAVLNLGLDMFFHQYCMKGIYAENAALFRPLGAMAALRVWSYLGYLVFGLLFVCIYSKGYEASKSPVGQGLRFGLLLGIFYWGASLLLCYPYMPWPSQLYLDWFAIGLFEFLVLGFILGMIYKPAPSA